MNNLNEQPAYRRVLLVDDNEIDRYIAKTVISRSNFTEHLTIVQCAKEALDHLHALSEDPELLPELVLLDINMPDMNGFDLLERFEEFPSLVKQHCSFVMLTSSLDKKDHQVAGNNPHVVTILNKPLNKEKLESLCHLHVRAAG